MLTIVSLYGEINYVFLWQMVWAPLERARVALIKQWKLLSHRLSFVFARASGLFIRRHWVSQEMASVSFCFICFVRLIENKMGTESTRKRKTKEFSFIYFGCTFATGAKPFTRSGCTAHHIVSLFNESLLIWHPKHESCRWSDAHALLRRIES